MSIKTYVVILNWNRKNLTISCVKSVLKSATKNIEIIPLIIDNASTDGSDELFDKLPKPCITIKNSKNLGYSAGNNVGIKFALKNKADCVIILNNDTIVKNSAIQELISFLFSSEKIGIVGPKIFFAKNKNILANAGGKIKMPRFFGVDIGCGEKDEGQFAKNYEVDFVTGACLCVKKSVFEKIGTFDERYAFYYEDADFCLKAKQNGFSSFIVYKSVIFHDVSSSVIQGSPLHHYYTMRNHLLFLEKNAPLKLKIREYFRTVKTIYQLVNEENSIKKKYSLLGIRDYFLRRFGQRSYW